MADSSCMQSDDQRLLANDDTRPHSSAMNQAQEEARELRQGLHTARRFLVVSVVIACASPLVFMALPSAPVTAVSVSAGGTVIAQVLALATMREF